MRRPLSRILAVAHAPDHPSAAVTRALALARRHGARVTVAHAFRGFADDADDAVTSPTLAEAEQREYELRMAWLRTLAAPLRAAGIEVEVRVLVGPPFVRIVHEVLDGGHDAVVKDAAADGVRHPRPFGSLDLHLLRKCPVPLWLVHPGRRRARRVVAAVDPSGAASAELDRRILAHAVDAAALDGGWVQVVHAWRLHGEGTLRLMRSSRTEMVIDRMVARERREHAERVDRLVEPFRGSGVALRVDVVKGDPALVVPAAVHEVRADLLVLGTVTQTRVPGLVIGTTAESILAEVRCSVLAVKPEGFVSPVAADPARRQPWRQRQPGGQSREEPHGSASDHRPA